MEIGDIVNGWLPLLGGITGLAWLVYMIVTLYYHRKKDHDIQSLRRDVAELKGLVVGKGLKR